jgi:hypothetical protein
MKFHATRIQHLAEVAPHRVTKKDGQLYAIPVNGESVNEMMVAVDALTADWAEANDLDPHAKAVRPSLEMVRDCSDRFFLDGFKLPKGWVTS